MIDPIDGTKMFAEGIPLWTTLIGLKDGERTGRRSRRRAGTRRALLGHPWRWRVPATISRSRSPTVAALGDAFVVHAPTRGLHRRNRS